jgi:hypothetical protein
VTSYLDSSVLIKLYVSERESEKVVNPDVTFVTAIIFPKADTRATPTDVRGRRFWPLPVG